MLPGMVDASSGGQAVPEAAMREPWELNGQEAKWSDPEAWRGERHPEQPAEWCPDAGEGWVWAGDDDLEEDDPAAAADWPEHLAGPEYWMYRRLDW